MTMSLGQLLPNLRAPLAAIKPVHLTLDSRAVSSGDVFLAIPGAANDGRAFVDQALNQGAAAVLADAKDGYASDNERVVSVTDLRTKLPELARTFYGDPSRHMALVAVTGTNGKTSVVDYTAQLLRHMGVATGTLGTLGARLSSAIKEAANTTPDVVSINRTLAQWYAQGVRHVAMEASSHALDQGRMAGLTVHSAAFTNLSRDHLDYHGSEERYARAKLQLFTEFSPSYALFNADDAVAARVAGLVSCPALGISLKDPNANVYVEVLSAAPLTLGLRTPMGSHNFSVNLSGSFNAFNAVLAIMLVVSLGYSLADAVQAAEQLVPVAGRMQRISNNQGVSVVVDYAHTPDALSRALQALRPETQGKLVVVFGCGGDRDRGKRALMARAAEIHADTLIVTSDNPRSEDPQAIIDEVVAGLRSGAQQVPDRREAIHTALGLAQPGDTVLIAGKGHEDYQDIAGQRLPFSDAAVAQDFYGEGVA